MNTFLKRKGLRKMKKCKKMTIGIIIFLGVMFAMARESQAMPNFARKYGADCRMCHTAVPMLNRFGYEFRAAGYRDPADIGKEDKGFDLGNFFAARIQEQFDYKKHTEPTTSNNSTNSQLTFKEFTMYPLTGSWGKYFSSLSELSVMPGNDFEVENAYVKGVYPVAKGSWAEGWFQGRIGVMHLWEGFGGADRPLGNLRPLFQTTAATGSPLVLWSPDEEGVEGGYYFYKTGTNITGVVWNGLRADGTAAKGGSLTKESTSPTKNDKDFQMVVNQFVHGDDSVSLFYYHGYVPFPATGTQTKDSYDRLAAYGNVYLIPDKVNAIGGYEYGHDALANASLVTGGSTVGNSNGFFAGAQYFAIPEKLALALRYDQFDPSNKVGHNGMNSITASANIFFTHGLQLVTDYQHVNTDITDGGKKTDDEVQARLIFIW